MESISALEAIRRGRSQGFFLTGPSIRRGTVIGGPVHYEKAQRTAESNYNRALCFLEGVLNEAEASKQKAADYESLMLHLTPRTDSRRTEKP
jgi:hypothetical protein